MAVLQDSVEGMVSDAQVVSLGEAVVLEAMLGPTAAAAAVEALERVALASAPHAATKATLNAVQNGVLAVKNDFKKTGGGDVTQRDILPMVLEIFPATAQRCNVFRVSLKAPYLSKKRI
jgi:hypothetical protein